jgi:hypothetical protein
MNNRRLFSTILLSLFASFLITGCDAPPRRVYTSSGAPALRITCDDSMDNCYDQADQLCPAGYRKIEEHEAPGDTSQTYVMRGSKKDDYDFIETTHEVNRSLTVQCK